MSYAYFMRNDTAHPVTTKEKSSKKQCKKNSTRDYFSRVLLVLASSDDPRSRSNEVMTTKRIMISAILISSRTMRENPSIRVEKIFIISHLLKNIIAYFNSKSMFSNTAKMHFLTTKRAQKRRKKQEPPLSWGLSKLGYQSNFNTTSIC